MTGNCHFDRREKSFRSVSTFGGCQWRGGEVYAEALTPHGHGAVFREVDASWQIIILIADVAFDAAEIDKAGLLNCRIVFRIGGRHQIDVHVRTIRGLEGAEA